MKPSESCPLLLCVADAGIESTPFEREGRAMVTREAGAVDVMTAATCRVPAQNRECQLEHRMNTCCFVVRFVTNRYFLTCKGAKVLQPFTDSLDLTILRIDAEQLYSDAEEAP